MGCDIHGPELWVHHKYAHGYLASHVATFKWSRDYTLFAIIADVRNDGTIKPISEGRGFPDFEWFGLPWEARRFVETSWDDEEREAMDKCPMMHEHYYDADCHTSSWLTLEEVAEAQRRYISIERRANADLSRAIAIMSVEKQLDPSADMRLLFCFDN